MTLSAPALDDRTFDDLLAEERALIPEYAPEWTNHNPSDPGITLLELFAWLAEMLVYRTDQVTERHVHVFLRLLNGPAWGATKPLDEELSAAVADLRRRTRAVTSEDYEALALEASPQVARARCIAHRYLAAGTEAERAEPRPGHVSIIILPRTTLSPNDLAKLRNTLTSFLEPYRLVTTRLTVADPVWAPIRVETLIARRPDVPEPTVRNAVVKTLTRFLDPLQGGQDGNGWPFGRSVYVSELFEQLEALPEVDYVADLTMTSTCSSRPRCAEAPPSWSEEGDLVGLELEQHHLAAGEIDPALVVSSARLVPVKITIGATAAPGHRTPAQKGAIKQAVRFFFRPGHGWPPKPVGPWEIGADLLRTVVATVPQVVSVQSVELKSEPGRVTQIGNVAHVRIDEGELADIDVEVTLA